MKHENLILPGNPRYQPKEMLEHFGYDNLYRNFAKVEIATLLVLMDMGIIPKKEAMGFKRGLTDKLLAIPTTEVDLIEREITHHDVRAWIKKARENF